MKKPQWFKLYPSEFLSDRNVEGMTLAEFGLYNYLLMRSWIDGGIPVSLDEMRRYAMLRGIRPGELEKLWKAVARCWQPSADPRVLVNPRQEIERELIGEYVLHQSYAGKASASKRSKQSSLDATEVEHRFNTGSTIQDTDKEQEKEREEDIRLRHTQQPGRVSPVVTDRNATSLPIGGNGALPGWNEFKTEYPPRRFDGEPALRAFVARQDETAAILAGLRVALKSQQWANADGKYVPKASRFISEGIYKDLRRFTQKASGGWRVLTDEEIFRRVDPCEEWPYSKLAPLSKANEG